MISILRGIVASVGLDHIDVVVGGIGFRVHVTPAFAQGTARDEEITVYTSMIVREDSMTLYGFESCDERDVFTTLRSVSGIGPKIALAALAVLRPDDLRRAVAFFDHQRVSVLIRHRRQKFQPILFRQ